MFSKQEQEDFLTNYWQQKPLLLRGFIPDFADPITPAILAGLACEDFVESRLISNPGNLGNWLLRHGPFAEEDFQQLPETNWTLLVQAVDQWHQETAALLPFFNFLSSWRIDDVMVSYATDNAGVGPHYDHYDVFLVQGAGSRKWRLGGSCEADRQWREDSELRILAEFETEQEFVLQPGDVLYIPPQYAHYGTSIGDSLCYSIGFRSPSQAEQLQGFSDEIIDGLPEHRRYLDPEPQTSAAIGEILASALDEAHQQLLQLVGDKQAFLIWFGKYVTLPKYPELITPTEQGPSVVDNTPLDNPELTFTVARNPGSRFAFIELTQQVSLFVDGEEYVFPEKQLPLVKKLCADKTFSVEDVQRFVVDAKFNTVIMELLNKGSLLVQ